MARPYPYANSAQTLYWPARGPQFFEDWDLPRDTDNEDLVCAEMCRLAYADRQTVSSALPTIKFTLRHWIGGETLAERRATGGTDGFIATSDNGDLTILAFRGTESNKPEDILADALATTVALYRARQRVITTPIANTLNLSSHVRDLRGRVADGPQFATSNPGPEGKSVCAVVGCRCSPLIAPESF